MGISGEPETPKNTWKKLKPQKEWFWSFSWNIDSGILRQHDFQMTPSVQFFLTLSILLPTIIFGFSTPYSPRGFETRSLNIFMNCQRFRLKKNLSNFQSDSYVMISKNGGKLKVFDFRWENFFFLKIDEFHEKRKKKILAQKTSFPQKFHKKVESPFCHFEKSFRISKKKISPFFFFSKRDLECENTLKNRPRTIWALWGIWNRPIVPVSRPQKFLSLWFFNQRGSFQHVTNLDASRLTKTTPFCDDFLCNMKWWERKYYFGGKKTLHKFISSLFLEKLARYWENYEIWCGKGFSFFKFFQVFFGISAEWTDISGSPEIFTWKLSVPKKSHEFFPDLSRKGSAF